MTLVGWLRGVPGAMRHPSDVAGAKGRARGAAFSAGAAPFRAGAVRSAASMDREKSAAVEWFSADLGKIAKVVIRPPYHA